MRRSSRESKKPDLFIPSQTTSSSQNSVSDEITKLEVKIQPKSIKKTTSKPNHINPVENSKCRLYGEKIFIVK